MLKLEVILAENDVMEISEGLKEIDVGGLTIIKVRGRGAKTEPEIRICQSHSCQNAVQVQNLKKSKQTQYSSCF